MTATLEDVRKKKAKPEPAGAEKVAEELVRRAREQAVALTGLDGLLKQLTETVLETAVSQEMTGHLGHGKHAQAGNQTGNVRNGTGAKTVLTEGSGPVGIEVPRDRAGTFEPQIVRTRQRRLSGVDEMVLSRYAKGLTTGEISAHFAEIYGASVSKETISRITGKVIEEMTGWCHRPLGGVYAAVCIDAVMVKVRDGQVANRPIYAAIGVSLAGERDILGLWAGSGGEGAKFWMSVLTELARQTPALRAVINGPCWRGSASPGVRALCQGMRVARAGGRGPPPFGGQSSRDADVIEQGVRRVASVVVVVAGQGKGVGVPGHDGCADLGPAAGRAGLGQHGGGGAGGVVLEGGGRPVVGDGVRAGDLVPEGQRPVPGWHGEGLGDAGVAVGG